MINKRSDITMINLKIDGHNISVANDTTIIEAAKSLGIEIPQLCYMKELSPFGGCRMCIVEINGKKKPEIACSTLCKEGMDIKTNTPRLQKYRRETLKLLMSNHKEECLVCSATGSCELQDLCFKLGVRGLYEGKKTKHLLDGNNPVIVRDQDKCIKCGKCVRVCNEIQVTGTYDFTNRGFETTVTTAFDQPLNKDICRMCGQCVSVCPTGALENKQLIRYRNHELEKVRTTCPFCGTGCVYDLNIYKGKVVGVTPVEDTKYAPINGTQMCVKGRFHIDMITSKDRVTTPLIKENGKFREATWEEALTYTAKRLTEIKEKYGSKALAGTSSARCTNEENYVLQKFVRAVLGSNNVDHCARICHAPSVTGLQQTFGNGAMTNSTNELLGADLIFIIGSNTTEAHPVIGNKVKQALLKGTKLIVADPRKTELARMSNIHMSQKSGSDIALMNGICNIIIENGWEDKDYVEKNSRFFEEFKDHVSKYTPEVTEEITGIDKETLYKVAESYAKADRAAIIYGLGITEHITGTNNVISISNLALLTGHVGRESTGVNPLRGQNNVQGACDMGALPNTMPGYFKVTDVESMRKFEEAWGVELDKEVGYYLPDMFDAGVSGDLKAMYLMGEDPLLTDPDTNHVIKCFNNLEFMACQEIFFSESTKYADVIFPAALYAEKDGTFTASERRVQRVRKAVEAPGMAIADWKIVAGVAKAMGAEGFDWKNEEEIFDEMRMLAPQFRGMTYERLEEAGLQWPCWDEEHPGTKFMYENGDFPLGKANFVLVDHQDPDELPDEDYPMILNTGRKLGHYNVTTRFSSTLNAINPYETAEIHPIDAKKLGIKELDYMKVTSRRGELITRANITDRVQPGMIFMTHHYKESPVNVLTNGAYDPTSKTAEFKVAAVKVEKVADRDNTVKKFVPLTEIVEG